MNASVNVQWGRCRAKRARGQEWGGQLLGSPCTRARDWPGEFGGGAGDEKRCAQRDGWGPTRCVANQKSEVSLLRLTVPAVQAFWLVRKMRMDARR